MKNFFTAIRQNNNLRKRLADEIVEGRFPHAYIIAGDVGSGKKTLALNIAAALACHDKGIIPCGTCDTCQKILNKFSPDVLFIKKETDKKEFTVNLIREIKESLFIAPNELEKRVYIIEDAETMNLNAQNAFLKMLEEPPSYVVFLLLCSNTENLLDTIKSRAPILYTEHIPNEEIQDFLVTNSANAKEMLETAPQKLATIIQTANGSIGRALSICENSDRHIETRTLVESFLSKWTSPSLSELDLFCDTVPSDSEVVVAFLDTLCLALRDVAIAKYDEECNLLFFNGYQDAEDYIARITTAKALKLINVADKLKEKINFYIDLRLALVTFCADAHRIMLG